MTAMDRFERDLPAGLEALAAPHAPDYLTDILGRTAVTSQRPAWTFPERWLPMADIASRRAFVPRMPWRLIAVALVILSLLISAAVFIGSRQTKLPPPFGPAGNGIVAYSKDGDIYTVDPRTGAAKAIVTGPETDVLPVFSNDGTRLAFLRADPAKCCLNYDVAVAAADGSDLRVLSMDPKMTSSDTVQFTPDARGLIVAAGGRLTLYDTGGVAAPKMLAMARFVAGEVRPGDGALLFENDATPEIDLWIMDADGSNQRLLIPATTLHGSQFDLALVRWSPDGSRFAFVCGTATDPDGSHICVADADGSNIRPVGDLGSDWFETDFVWSPDGQSLAFNRWRDLGSGHVIQPIGLTSADGGAVRSLGTAPAPDGALFDFSPDGTMIHSLPATVAGGPVGAAPARPIGIDVADGTEREFVWDAASNVSWQRVALEP